jgi:hypothetical protein
MTSTTYAAKPVTRLSSTSRATAATEKTFTEICGKVSSVGIIASNLFCNTDRGVVEFGRSSETLPPKASLEVVGQRNSPRLSDLVTFNSGVFGRAYIDQVSGKVFSETSRVEKGKLVGGGIKITLQEVATLSLTKEAQESGDKRFILTPEGIDLQSNVASNYGHLAFAKLSLDSGELTAVRGGREVKFSCDQSVLDSEAEQGGEWQRFSNPNLGTVYRSRETGVVYGTQVVIRPNGARGIVLVAAGPAGDVLKSEMSFRASPPVEAVVAPAVGVTEIAPNPEPVSIPAEKIPGSSVPSTLTSGRSAAPAAQEALPAALVTQSSPTVESAAGAAGAKQSVSSEPKSASFTPEPGRRSGLFSGWRSRAAAAVLAAASVVGLFASKASNWFSSGEKVVPQSPLVLPALKADSAEPPTMKIEKIEGTAVVTNQVVEPPTPVQIPPQLAKELKVVGAELKDGAEEVFDIFSDLGQHFFSVLSLANGAQSQPQPIPGGKQYEEPSGATLTIDPESVFAFDLPATASTLPKDSFPYRLTEAMTPSPIPFYSAPSEELLSGVSLSTDVAAFNTSEYSSQGRLEQERLAQALNGSGGVEVVTNLSTEQIQGLPLTVSSVDGFNKEDGGEFSRRLAAGLSGAPATVASGKPTEALQGSEPIVFKDK